MEHSSQTENAWTAARCELEPALRESEARYRDIVENIGDLIQIIGPDGRYLFVNPAWKRTLGYDDHDLATLTFADIVHEDHLARCQEIFQGLKRGESCDNEEIVFKAKDGRHVLVEGSLSSARENGEMVRARAIFRNITERKRTEEALWVSQQRFGLVADALPCLIIYLDTDLRYRYVNKAHYRWHGLRAEKVLGKSLSEIIGPRAFDNVRPHIEAALSGKQAAFEDEHTYGGIGMRYIHTTYVPRFGKTGEIQGIFGLVVDLTDEKVVTELKRAEEALLLTQFAIDHASDAVYWLDRDSSIVYANDTASSMLGYSRKELLGLSVPEYDPDVTLEDSSLAFERIKKGGSSTFEARHRAKDGMIIPVEVSMYYLKHGDKELMACITRNITERKRMEEALSKTKAQLTDAIESMSDGFAVFDVEDRLVLCNGKYREIWAGIGDLLVPGARFEDMMRAAAERGLVVDVAGRVEDWVRERVEEHQAAVGSDELGFTDGRWVQAVDRKTSDGGIVCIRTDVTEMKQALERVRQHEAELAQALRLGTMGEMAVGLSHQLNQPLTSIVINCDTLVSELRSGKWNMERLRDALNHNCELAKRASKIVEDIGNFVRKSEPQKSEEDINEIVRSAVCLGGAELLESGVGIVLDLSEVMPPVPVAAIEIEQVLVNLVRNGIEAMRETEARNRELTIETSMASAGEVKVAVKDAGSGLPQGMRAGIFEPFVTTKPAGTGMGLSISRTIVEAHGGRIWATHNPAGGATIHFTLPADGKGLDDGH